MTDLNKLKFSKEHEWIKKENDTYIVGITEYAQDNLGDVVFIELPELNSEFEKDDFIGNIESVKAVSEIYIPLSGEIIEVNDSLHDTPELINSEPYENGWIFKIKAKNSSEFDTLMDWKTYEDYTKSV